MDRVCYNKKNSKTISPLYNRCTTISKEPVKTSNLELRIVVLAYGVLGS